MRGIIVGIDPQGQKWFAGYGPWTQDRAKAIEFVSMRVAHAVAISSKYGRQDAFWECERKSAKNTKEVMRKWTVYAEESSAG